MINLLQIKKNHLYTGRAATAIYLILMAEELSGKRVLFPANICYAAVYPAIYAGCIPVFCDIDPKSGNISVEEFYKRIDDVEAAVIPHMYGNPVPYIESIATECRRRGVLLIEDCASAMGAQVEDRLCGEFGDYSIFSTGYAKTIDIGRGGILLSDRSLNKIVDLYRILPDLSQEAVENVSFFSKLYRLIRNNPRQTLDKIIWKNISEELKSSFLYKEDDIGEQIEAALIDIQDVIKTRRENADKYSELIDDIPEIELYEWEEGRVPWRYNIFVESDIRSELIKYLLERNLPVSDWYPVVTSIFADETIYKNAEEMGGRILNFPLIIDICVIQEICRSLADFYG